MPIGVPPFFNGFLQQLPFTVASLIGRGARFYLVAGLMAWGGARMEAALLHYVDRLGWATVALAAPGVLFSR